MTYDEFRVRSSFSQEHVLALAHGSLFDDAPAGYNARLPLPPMLMVDRIDEFSAAASIKPADVLGDHELVGAERGVELGHVDVRPAKSVTV